MVLNYYAYIFIRDYTDIFRSQVLQIHPNFIQNSLSISDIRACHLNKAKQMWSQTLQAHKELKGKE